MRDQDNQKPENEVMVRDPWVEDRGWDWARLADRQSHTNLLKLAFVLLRNDDQQGDQMVWLKPNGAFSVSSVYELYMGTKEDGTWPGWKWTWELKVQQRIRTFMWTPAYDRILTNYCRWRRKLADNLSCARCRCDVEDALHTLRDCPTSMEVWMHSLQGSSFQDFFLLPLRDWMMKCLSLGRKRAKGEI